MNHSFQTSRGSFNFCFVSLTNIMKNYFYKSQKFSMEKRNSVNVQ